MVRERSADLLPGRGGRRHSSYGILVMLICANLPAADCEGISPERCLIWGPGLDPDAVLPVRYFFIQAVDSEGKNLTISPGNCLQNAPVKPYPQTGSVSVLNVESFNSKGFVKENQQILYFNLSIIAGFI